MICYRKRFSSGPIVFDTVNFSPSVGKTTEKDRQIFTQLLNCLRTPIDSKKFYANLKESSSDATGMDNSKRINSRSNVFRLGYSIQDLLQKDAKQIIAPKFRLIMSSLPTNYSVEVNRLVFAERFDSIGFFFLCLEIH